MNSMREIVTADIGGTHARFAIATVADGQLISVGNPVKLATADHSSLQSAWEMFGAELGRTLPDAAAIAVAAPIRGDVIKLTNNPWIIQPAQIGSDLGISDHILLNDFEAVAFAVAAAAPEDFQHVTGPQGDLGGDGVISVVGPGTGLGVAAILRKDGQFHVLPTEGGHIDFAPLDDVEERILAHLRAQHGRVSTERAVSGPGLRAICDVLAAIEGAPPPRGDDTQLWTMALNGSDNIAAAALDRFCMMLGSAAGNISLAHGPGSLVLAGGLGARLTHHAALAGFAHRFVAKGRYRSLMENVPVKSITMAEPGLYGAAVAFAAVYGSGLLQSRAS